jgi:hypothetical protein
MATRVVPVEKEAAAALGASAAVPS